MAWIARDKDERLFIYECLPERVSNKWLTDFEMIELPSDADEKLIGKHIDWTDKPVEIQKIDNMKLDTKNVVLVATKGQTVRGERCADIVIKDGMNFCIGSINLVRTRSEDANALAAEIVRRFNEFPAELKK